MTNAQWALEPHPVRFIYPDDHRARIRQNLVDLGCPEENRDYAVEVGYARYYGHTQYPEVWFSH